MKNGGVEDVIYAFLFGFILGAITAFTGFTMSYSNVGDYINPSHHIALGY